MDHPALLTLCALASALAGYSAATAYHRRRARRRERARAVTERLLRAGDHHHIETLRGRLSEQRNAEDALTSATDTVDAAYARLTRSQEGGPTP